MKMIILMGGLVLGTGPLIAPAGAELPETTPTGILLDRVVCLSHLEDLHGGTETPAVDLARWRQVVHELQRSAEGDLSWPDAHTFRKEGLGSMAAGEVPLALVWAAYDRLDNEKEPCPATIFSFAPLRQDVYHGQKVEFTLSADDLLTHGPSQETTFLLDPGNGSGWQRLKVGQPLIIAYSKTEQVVLRLRAVLDDGTHLEAATHLNIIRLDTPQPHATWPITATESYGGVHGTGLAHVYLSEQHSTLTNPVVIVEGFDLDNSMDWPVLYEFLNQENLLEDMRAAGFDAVVLDFTEATDPIQRNAFVLTRLLEQVRQNTGQETSLALVGASMGGLVSRYALAWLEDQGINHGVRSFVSFDSPQNGANIPLGLQHWLDFFREESLEAAYLLSRLNTPASRQMLLYHHDNGTSTPGADPLFGTLRNDLANLGNWPQQPRLVSVVNGSGSGVDQGFTAGQQIIQYEYRSTLVDIDGNVWALPSGNSQTIFEGMINLIWPLPDVYETITVSGTWAMDNAPGGGRPSMAQMDTTAVPYGDIVALHDVHCFIPTVSALALEVADPWFDIAGAGNLSELTPFDQVFFPLANQEHIQITAENKAWFMEEMATGVTPVADELPGPAGKTLALIAAPNPFNPRTLLSYRLDQDEVVDLDVFDVSGRRVRTLLKGQPQQAGEHSLSWNGRNDRGQSLAAGWYLMKLRAGDRVETRSVMLIK